MAEKLSRTPEPGSEQSLESLVDQSKLGDKRAEPIKIDEWAGGLPEEQARVPSVRIGRRWFSALWLIPIGIATLVVAVALAQHLRQHEWMQAFIAEFPGPSATYAPPVDSGFPAWLRWLVRHCEVGWCADV